MQSDAEKKAHLNHLMANASFLPPSRSFAEDKNFIPTAQMRDLPASVINLTTFSFSDAAILLLYTNVKG